jgi:hypothetical protein
MSKNMKVIEYDSSKDTEEHVVNVRENIRKFCTMMFTRGLEHDQSKFENPEKQVFDRVTPALKALTYGSDEYLAQLAEMGEALQHHYKCNRHHPEHFEDGVLGMTLVDVVEMFCDWCAATERHDDGDRQPQLVDLGEPGCGSPRRQQLLLIGRFKRPEFVQP